MAREPLRWSYGAALVHRRDALVRGVPWRHGGWDAASDGLFAATDLERNWAETQARKLKSAHFCASLQRFDARIIDGLPLPEQEGAVRRLMAERSQERQARHATGRFVPSFVYEWHTLKAEGLARYAAVPLDWSELEAPWGLSVPSPCASKLWGITLARAPWRGEETLRDHGARVNAYWSAVHTFYLHDYAGELLSEAADGSLWWAPVKMLFSMEALELARMASDDGIAGRLGAIIWGIRRVRWDRVDPVGCVRPEVNTSRAPVLAWGDWVSWDANEWALAVVALLLRPLRQEEERPLGCYERRGLRLQGDYAFAWRPCQGHAVRLPGWNDVCLDLMRVGGPRKEE